MMKTKTWIFFILITLVLFACQSKNESLIAQKWECIKIENLDPINPIIATPEDSIIAAKVQQALDNLQWKFDDKKNYQCSTNGAITATGEYKFNETDKLLVLTSTNENVSAFHILSLSKTEMTLKSLDNNSNIIMHFKSND